MRSRIGPTPAQPPCAARLKPSWQKWTTKKRLDRKSKRLNTSHLSNTNHVFWFKKIYHKLSLNQIDTHKQLHSSTTRRSSDLAGATAMCGKVEAELAEMDDEEAA